MRVSRVEVFGFKSFMDRLVLPLEQGITGVVGPNGCGKSNIVDAIRWVLGETRAKNLRGGLLEDVIFNGTDKLRPLGLAEVSLTIQSEGNDLLSDLVSPDLEAELVARNVSSEQQEEANQEHVSVDSNDTEDESGSLVDQLEVTNGDEASDDSQDQVAITNAGEVAASSLIEKYSWLKSASEVQVTRRLYRSGESEFFINRVPCRLKDMKDFFRAVGLSSKGFTIVAQGEISRIITAKPAERRKLLEEAAGVQGFRDRINATENRLRDTNLNLERVHDIITEISRQVNSLKRQANRAKNRDELMEQIATLEKSVLRSKLYSYQENRQELDGQLSAAKSEEETANTEFTAKREQEELLRGELIQIDADVDAKRDELEAVRGEINKQLQEETNRVARNAEIKAQLASAAEKQEQMKIASGDYAGRKEQVVAELLGFEEQKKEFVEQYREIQSASHDEYESLHNQLKAKKQKLQDLRAERSEKHGEIRAVTAELKVLSNQLQQNSLSAELQDMLQQYDSGVQALYEVVQISPDYSKAFAAALGDQTRYFLIDNPLGLSAEFVQAANADGCKFGLIDKSPAQKTNINRAVPFEKLLDQLKYPDRYDAIFKQLLAQVYIATDAEAARNYYTNNSDSDITFVTKAGQLISSTVTAFGQSTDVIDLKTRCDQLTNDLAGMEQGIAEHDRKVASHEELVQADEQRLEEMQSERAIAEKELQALSSKIGSIDGQITSSQRIETQLGQDIDRCHLDLQSLVSTQTSLTSELAGIEQLLIAPQFSYEELEEKESAMAEECAVLETGRKEKRQVLDDLTQAFMSVRERLDSARQTLGNWELKAQKIDLNHSSITERIVAEYSQEFLDEQSQGLSSADLVEKEELKEQSEELAKLKGKMSREGAVDPESIALFEEQSTRLAELEEQRDDLQTALKDLRATLDRLVTTSEERFAATFRQVASNFETLVPKMFGGGYGKLELDDPNNPLESGLSIVTRPPGKKLKSIELMSGGEKALAATALIVSMFMVRPSPLCILDEVDAPLDDANLERFLGVIKEMSTETQFMLITHNKQSMSVADRLVGVTMQQPGATKILTVDLQEAQTHAA